MEKMKQSNGYHNHDTDSSNKMESNESMPRTSSTLSMQTEEDHCSDYEEDIPENNNDGKQISYM
jgi:hypothetical protein